MGPNGQPRRTGGEYRGGMSPTDIDAYLAKVPEPQRSTLSQLRQTLRRLLPEATEGISYGVPCLKVDGKAVAGFAAYSGHNSYLPMSGTVLTTVAGDVRAYETSKGALKFALDTPLPEALVRTLITARLAEIRG